jgi:small nuclear ribonucleoprotein (snRNP)-like protein
MFVGPDGARTDTMVQYSKDTLLVLAERIEHFEELKQKTYQMGERPAKIRAEEAATQRTQGTDVAVVLTSGEKIEGELVSVRDSSVLIATRSGGIVPIKDTVVSLVIVKGNSHVLTGMGVGFLVAGTIGAVLGGSGKSNKRYDFAIFFSSDKEEAEFDGFLLGGLIGTVFGGLLGAGASQSDIEVSLPVQAERSALKKLARYPDKEPEFLEVIK